MMDPIRRNILKTGAAAATMAAAPGVFAQQTGQGGAALSFYEKGKVRIRYQEAGSGFPLLLIAGGGLNSTISGITGSYPPFNAIEEFKSSTAASLSTCATRTPVSPLARLTSSGPGIPTPMTSLA